jgi:dynein heavy chain 1
MNLENYVNLTTWVEELNSTIEDILLERLKEAIVAWTSKFNFDAKGSDVYSHRTRRLGYGSLTDDVAARTKAITLESVLHELTIRNQVIFLEPPLEHARAICLSSLHEWLGKVLIELPNIFRSSVQSSSPSSHPIRIDTSSFDE